MRSFGSHFFISLFAHAFLGAVMSLFLFFQPPMIAGSAGLAGSPQTRISFVVDVGSERTTEKTVEKSKTPIVQKPLTPPPAIKEGLEVLQPKEKIVQRELPSEVKNPETREIEKELIEDKIETSLSSATQSDESDSDGNSETAPAGALGQGGTGDEVAINVGNSDQTNAMGIYLSKLRTRVQKNLAVPFNLEKTVVAQLEILLAPSGNPLEILILKSSGDQKLDLMAINATRKALPVGALSDELRVQIPVTFRAKKF